MAEGLSAEQVKKIAALSGLSLGDDEVPAEAERLSAVLDHMTCLGELDLEGVEPLAQVGEEHSRVRTDEPGKAFDASAAVGLAPASYESMGASGEGGARFFRVPKVIGGESGGGA